MLNMEPSRKKSMAKNNEEKNKSNKQIETDNNQLSEQTEQLFVAQSDTQINMLKPIKDSRNRKTAFLRSKKTPKRIRQSIKLDVVNPTDFLTYNSIHSCEQCSHWNQENGLCTLGYKNDVHRLAANLKCYELNGKMAFCRFLEID